ncbi:MAG TPA: ATP-grasp domain-containing protein [Bacteroidia bacterium]|nr:ATP-grasp domain-containing protein [Bacteroidia bacterium]
MNVLLEACGSLTSAYLIKAIKDAGHTVVASDIAECAASYTAHEFITMPGYQEPDLWEQIEKHLLEKGVNLIIPSFDETLIGWSERKEYFLKKNIHVILSDLQSIAICQDKWKTYHFFKSNGIPTPETSLEYVHPLVKPRQGRGGKDIRIGAAAKDVKMEGMISQELLHGEEYTIDVFCNHEHVPVYIIPRKRLQVKDGKSLNGITVNHPEIIKWVRKICSSARFIGPINIQCFVNSANEVKFTEINPRVAGGMALGFAASENWIRLIIDHLIEKKEIEIKPVIYGLKMFRYYDEVFVS